MTSLKDLSSLIEEKDQTMGQWKTSLELFVSTFKDSFDFTPTQLPEVSKARFLDNILFIILRDNWTDECIVLALTSIKLITRSRSGLSPLYKDENIKNLICLTENNDISVSHQAICVLLNIMIINAPKLLKALFNSEYYLRIFNLLERYSSHPTLISPLIRLLFYFGLDIDFVKSLVNDHDFFKRLIDSFVFRFPSIDSIHLDQSDTVLIIGEYLKTLFNFNSHDKLPKVFEKIEEATFRKFGSVALEILTFELSEEERKILAENGQLAKDSVYKLKLDVVHLMLYMTEAFIDMIDDTRYLESLAFILLTQARMKDDPEGNLAPLCMILTGIANNSKNAKKFFLKLIFGDLAFDVNGESGMAPAGAKDADPDSLMSILIKHMTSFRASLKHTVSELIYALCSHDTKEFIRLTGFGNAVGLLAEKGLPGFAHLKDNAIDVDQLLESGKKL